MSYSASWWLRHLFWFRPAAISRFGGFLDILGGAFRRDVIGGWLTEIGDQVNIKDAVHSRDGQPFNSKQVSERYLPFSIGRGGRIWTGDHTHPKRETTNLHGIT
jgi:hypothetical protein